MTWRYVETECPGCCRPTERMAAEVLLVNGKVEMRKCPACKGTGKVGVLVAGPVTVGDHCAVRNTPWPHDQDGHNETWRPGPAEAEIHCRLTWQRDSTECPCDGGVSHESYADCPDCGGAGRTLRVARECGFRNCRCHVDVLRLHRLTVIGYRQATKLETRWECHACSGEGEMTKDLGVQVTIVCANCQGTGYIDAEPGLYVAGVMR